MLTCSLKFHASNANEEFQVIFGGWVDSNWTVGEYEKVSIKITRKMAETLHETSLSEEKKSKAFFYASPILHGKYNKIP